MDTFLQNLISGLVAFDAKTLKRAQGDFQFTDIETEIDEILDFARNLSQDKGFYDILPDTEQDSLNNQIQRAQDLFSRIKNFSPSTLSNPQDIRNALANETIALYREIFPKIMQFDTYQLRSKGAQGKLTNIILEAKNTLKDAQIKDAEISELLQSAKHATSRVSLFEYIGIFGQVSVKYQERATKWLWASGLLAIALLGYLYLVGLELSQIIPHLSTTQEIVSIVIVKLFFIAIAVYILQQVIRNYMANMHLGILNEQRENSLKVFDAMVKSTTAPETTDQVLSYLAKSIFEAGDTGFFPGKDISKDGPDLIQIIKNIGKPA